MRRKHHLKYSRFLPSVDFGLRKIEEMCGDFFLSFEEQFSQGNILGVQILKNLFVRDITFELDLGDEAVSFLHLIYSFAFFLSLISEKIFSG